MYDITPIIEAVAALIAALITAFVIPYIKPGVYTIVEESAGAGATKWGKLKSGVGWISLGHAKKI